MRDRLTSLVLALLAIFVLAAIFFDGEAKIETSMPHTEDRGDQGLASFYQWLKLRGVPVQSNRRRWHELLQGQGHVLLTHAPYRMQEEQRRNWKSAPRAYQEARETTALRRWVAQGNTLMIAVSSADVDAPEVYMRDEERGEANYFDLLKKFGWTLDISVSDLEGSQIDSSGGEASAEYDEEAIDNLTQNKQVRDQEQMRPSAPRSRAEPSDVTGKVSVAREVKPQPLPIDPAQARPQAMHQLSLRVPGSKLETVSIETMSWISQYAHSVTFAPNQGDYEDANCRAQRQSREDSDASDADDDEDSLDDEELLELEVPRADKPEAIVDEGIFASTETKLDFSGDEILPDGTTIGVDGSVLKPYCQSLALQKALPLLFSDRDQSEQGWWTPFGQGRIVVLAYGGLFRNRSLHMAENARAGELLLRRFVHSDGRVLFDDYRYGLSDVYDPEAFFKDRRLHITLAIALLVWLMYAVGRRASMLAARPAMPRFTSAQLARNLRQFFARKLSPANVATLLLEHFEAAVARRFVLAIDADEPQSERLGKTLQSLKIAKQDIDALMLLSDGSNNEALSQQIAALSERLQLHLQRRENSPNSLEQSRSNDASA